MNKFYLSAAVTVTVVLMIFFPHLLPWIMGIYPVPAGTSPWYQFWSGFYITLLSAVTSSWLRKQNCHVRWCWRLGRFPVAEGALLVCRHHHPDPAVHHNRVTHEHVLRIHREHAEHRGNNRPG